MSGDQNECRKLPLDVLGVVAATFIKGTYELHLFAAVSRTWLRAVATSEDLHQQRLAEIAFNDGFLDPSRDVEMWMLDVDQLHFKGDMNQLPNARLFNASKFLVREMLVERAATCGLEYLRLNAFSPEQRKMGEQLPNDAIRSLSIDKRLGSDEEVISFVSKRCALTFLRFDADNVELTNVFTASLATLCALDIYVFNAANPLLVEMPLLERLTVNERSASDSATHAPMLENISKLHQLKDLRLRLSTWDDGLRSWPSKLSGLTRLETLEMQSGAYEPDLVFDGAGFSESLTFLNFSWISYVTTATAVSVANTFPRLKVLHATMCQEDTIGDAGYAAIGSKLKELKHVELWMNGLSFSQLQSLSGLQHLELLSIAGAKFDGFATSDQLVKVWSSMPSLTALGLEDSANLYTRDTCEALLDSLAACPKLKMLNLDRLGTTRHPVPINSAALGALTELEAIKLSGSSVSAKTVAAMSRFTKIKSFEAVGCQFLSKEADLFALIKNNCAQLAVVNLQDTGGIETEHIILLGTLCRHLVTLDLSTPRQRGAWAGFAKGVEALGDVPFFPALTKLGVGRSGLHDDDVIVILQRAHSLESLDLADNVLLSKYLVPFLRAARFGYLNLKGCAAVGRPVDVLMALMRGNPRLHTFNMRSVTQEKLSDAKQQLLEEAVARHPSMTVIDMDGISDDWNTAIQSQRYLVV